MEEKKYNDVDKDTIEIDLKRLFFAVLHRIWIVILAAAICAASALLFTYYMIEPQYKASVMFYVNNNSVSIGDSFSLSDINSRRELVNSYIVMLKSRNSLNDVIDYADLDCTYEELRAMVSAAQINSTEIFEVVVTNPDPAEAEKTANAIAYILPNKIASIVEGSSARVVDYAVLPTSPASPNYIKNTAIGLLAGMLISILIIVLREIFDVTIHTQEDIEQLSSIPVLASVPDMYTRKKGKYYYYSKYEESDDNRKKKHNGGISPIKAETSFVGKNLSFAAAEANKMLRTKILFSFSDQSTCHIVGVSSAMVSEGKSLSSVNLAYSMAQLDKKVLLIDCDLRRPSVYKKLKIRKSAGMTEYLTGQSELNDIIQTYTDSDDSAPFDVIISGETPPNPMELLSSEKMQGVLSTLRNTYDYIIIDLPPIGEVSDALAVSKFVDGILIVVRQNYCTRSALISAVQQFEFMEARILGIIFNCTVEGEYRYKYKKYGRYGKYGKYYGKYKYYSAYDKNKNKNK